MTKSSLDSLLLTNKHLKHKGLKPENLGSRNFYHMAAALAYRDADSLAGSQLLEADYQDCLLSFNARGKRLDEKISRTQIIAALNKLLLSQKNLSFDDLIIRKNMCSPARHLLEQPEYSRSRHNLIFKAEEIAALVLWVLESWDETPSLLHKNYALHEAAQFHHELTTMAQRPNERPFWFSGIIDNVDADMLVENANLYSANRLSKKSWQIDNGATAGVRYYHAALRAKQGSVAVDVLYWLKFDDNHQIIDGEFIHRALPKRILCPITDLSRWAQAQDGPQADLIREIIDMYLASLGVQ